MNKDEYIQNLEKRVSELEKENTKLRKQFEEHLRICPLVKKTKTVRIPVFKPNRKTKQKRPGRKKGHKGVTRPLPDHVDETIKLKYNTCPDCNTKLKTMETSTHIVEDIKTQKNYHNKKYKIQRHWYPKCKQTKSPKKSL